MGIFDREPVNRKDRRKQAKELQKQNTDFRMSPIGRKLEIEQKTRKATIERLLQQGISPEDLKKEYEHGFDEGYKLAGTQSVKMVYAAVCLALRKMHGFGKQRCREVLREIDRTIIFELSSQDLIDKVYDEIGLELAFDDPFERVQEKEE